MASWSQLKGGIIVEIFMSKVAYGWKEHPSCKSSCFDRLLLRRVFVIMDVFINSRLCNMKCNGVILHKLCYGNAVME